MAKLLAFGWIGESLPKNHMDLEAKDVMEVKDFVQQNIPHIDWNTCTLAVNQQIVTENLPLSTSDEVAIMPPFSGG